MFKQLYLRIKYRKQLKAGFGLLHDHGAKRHFAVMDGRAFIMNGVDPLVRVDLSTGKATNYVAPMELPAVVNKDYDWDGVKTISVYRKDHSNV